MQSLLHFNIYLRAEIERLRAYLSCFSCNESELAAILRSCTN